MTKVLDDVFQRFLDNNKIFKNREVLRHDFIPEKLPHREEQIIKLAETLAPILKNARCSNIFVYGKTGTGKTLLARAIAGEADVPFFHIRSTMLPFSFAFF